MVWVKLTDDFPDAAARAKLSDAAFRVHVEGLCWAMRRENGGLLDHLDIRRACEIEDPKAAVRELVDADWWVPAGDDCLQIVQSMEDQPEPDVIEARRCQAADRQRRKRRKAVKLDTSRRDDMRDDPRDPGRDGSGRDGGTTSEGDLLSKPVAPKGEEVRQQSSDEDWPAVAIPGLDFPTTVVPGPRTNVVRHTADEDYCKSCGHTSPKHTGSCKVGKRAA